MAEQTTYTVLLVEDDEALGGALQFALQIEGWRVELRTSGEALLDTPLPAGPLCLVVDIQLPGISGVEAMIELRRRGDTTPAILITTDPRPALRRAATKIGARIIEKPLISDDLLSAIRGYLT